MSIINDELKKSAEGDFVEFPDNGVLPPMKIQAVEYVHADKYGDSKGMKYQISFEGGQMMSTTSRKFIRLLDQLGVEMGDLIRVIRKGTGTDTRYDVELVEKAPKA